VHFDGGEDTYYTYDETADEESIYETEEKIQDLEKKL